MRTTRAVLIIFSFSVSSCIPFISGEKSKHSKATDLLKEDSYQSAASIGPVFVATLKPVTRKVSGRVYCGEGLAQRPANKATVNIMNNGKMIATATTESDGAFSFSTKFELDGGYEYSVKSSCGTKTTAVPSDLSRDLENQDFWIK